MNMLNSSLDQITHPDPRVESHPTLLRSSPPYKAEQKRLEALEKDRKEREKAAEKAAAKRRKEDERRKAKEVKEAKKRSGKDGGGGFFRSRSPAREAKATGAHEAASPSSPKSGRRRGMFRSKSPA